MEGLIEGRIVHYISIDYRERPAIVVSVQNKEKGIVNLQVFDDIGERQLRLEINVHYNEEKIGNSWHWIERV